MALYRKERVIIGGKEVGGRAYNVHERAYNVHEKGGEWREKERKSRLEYSLSILFFLYLI